jgi:RNA ligase
MKYDLNILNDYISRRLLVKQDHPTLPLSIYMYSRGCQYDGLWDDVTIMCRGLVLDNDGNVIAKPFSKFWNLEENKHIPTQDFNVQEKLDGSLVIVFFYNGELVISTKGSFISDQARWAKKIMDEKYRPTLLTDKDVYEATDYNYSGDELTYMFELIKKNKKIVVDYGDTEELFLLSCIHTKTGKELTYPQVKKISEILGCPIVKQYDGISDYNTLKDIIKDNQEGFVVKFSNGSMCKIKGDEYIRLHRILTNISTTMIWELLSTDGDINLILERVPDEFDKWVKARVRELKYAFFQIDERAGKLHDYFRYGKYGDVYPEPTKKEFAEYVMKQEKILRPIMFAMWDGRPYDHMIWKLIKPKWSKPFIEDLDN